MSVKRQVLGIQTLLLSRRKRERERECVCVYKWWQLKLESQSGFRLGKTLNARVKNFNLINKTIRNSVNKHVEISALDLQTSAFCILILLEIAEEQSKSSTSH